MVKKQSREAAAVGIVLMWCLVLVCPTWAQESEDVKNGFYLGAMFVHNSMSGDFDETSLMTEEGDEELDNDIVFVPELDDGTGFGLVLGRRYGKFSMEVGYQRTAHDTSFGPGDEDDAAYNVIDLNVKIDVFAQNKLRPYVLLGGGFPWLTVEDGTLDNSGSLDDSKYYGFCLNAGVGVAYYFDPQWAITGGLIHRWNWFTHVDNFRIDDDITERALGLMLGVAYTF
jgi:hypothetical protein